MKSQYSLGRVSRWLQRAVLLVFLSDSRLFCVVAVGQKPAPAVENTGRKAQFAERDRLRTEALKLRAENKLSAALAAGEKVLAIEREVLPAATIDQFYSLNWLAGVAEAAENWKQAAAFRDEALAWSTEHRGATHWRTTDARLALEQVRKLQSLSAAARDDLARAERLDGDGVRLYGEGKFSEAVTKAKQSRDLRKQVLGETHSTYATSLYNLAALYHKMGAYARAEPLYLQSRDIRKQALGETHPDYATSLNNLALLYDKMGAYARAEPLYLQSRDIRKQALGETHPDYATSLNNLALLYDKMGAYARAEPLYLQSRDIRKQALGETHPDYAASLNNLAWLYQAMGDYARAEPLYRQALSITRASLESTSAIQSERQQLAMGQLLCYQLDGYVSLGLNSDRYVRSVFGQVLTWKGATLMRQRGMRLAAADPAVSELFGKLQNSTRQLAMLSRNIPAQEVKREEWRTRLAILTVEKERLESELSGKSAAFRHATQAVTLEDLLTALPQDAVLIDFLEFDRSTPSREKGEKATRERQLVAFVVRHAEQPEDQVTMVGLGATEPLGKAIDIWRASYGAGAEGAAAGKQLRTALWEPLLPSLDKARTILVSTDGVLGRLPLAALPGKDPTKYLLEEYRLAMLPVPQLLPTLDQRASKRTALERASAVGRR
jgi:hypothetical protein